ncbi:MAG TPA: diacylglycerol kinase [Terriglobia bacterium]|nr:diacylglycerol kinase [Terriglobia bacterium]
MSTCVGAARPSYISMLIVFLLVALLFHDCLHLLLLLAVTRLMVVAEIFKSTVAALRDYVQPRHDNLITGIKDMALGASW